MSPEFVRPPQIISSPGPKKFWWTFGRVFEGIALSDFIFLGGFAAPGKSTSNVHMLPALFA
jgi:hypothetical protein